MTTDTGGTVQYLKCGRCGLDESFWTHREPGGHPFLPPVEAERITLENCVCGQHFDCPDGWHYGDDLPCSCTPDCALGGEDECDGLAGDSGFIGDRSGVVHGL